MHVRKVVHAAPTDYRVGGMAMKVIGLAGRPGSGKSAVGEALSRRSGVVWVDLDRVAWETYAMGTPIHAQLVESLGCGILAPDGAIDRRRLAGFMFADPDVRGTVEAIVHPAVGERLRRRIETERRQGTSVLLVEGALLAHSVYVDRSLFDRILWLDASDDTRQARLRSSGRLSHAGRLDDRAPGEGVMRIDAAGSIADVADRIWRAIELSCRD